MVKAIVNAAPWMRQLLLHVRIIRFLCTEECFHSTNLSHINCARMCCRWHKQTLYFPNKRKKSFLIKILVCHITISRLSLPCVCVCIYVRKTHIDKTLLWKYLKACTVLLFQKSTVYDKGLDLATRIHLLRISGPHKLKSH